MKRILAFSFVAIASAALAQTPTVVEKPAVKKPASQTTSKTSTKTSAQSSKPSAATVKTATVKVVPVPAAKPAAVAAKPVVVSAKPTVVSAHTAAAKPVVVPTAGSKAAPAKPVAVVVSGKPVVVAAPMAHAVPVSAKPATVNAVKLGAVQVKPAPMKSDPFKSAAAQKAPAQMKPNGQPVVARLAPAPATGAKTNSAPQAAIAVQDTKQDTKAENKPADDNNQAKAINTAGRRDPFVSPVVNLGASGSGCSSGKRCLAIDEVALRGVVKSEGGMIAVVVNSLDKAYFLRENDPVFNGYVVKITGDSIVFKETFHDKLGKPLTRDVTKTITAPAA
jgi:Tfp pilus assembly protein PilP